MVTIDVHNRDVVGSLRDAKITSSKDGAAVANWKLTTFSRSIHYKYGKYEPFSIANCSFTEG